VYDELSEIVHLYGVSHVFLTDSCFGENNQRAVEVANLLHRLGLTWECMMTPHDASAELIKMLASRGCKTVRLGVETFSIDSDPISPKGSTLVSLEETIHICAHVGVTCICFLILGLPQETEDSLNSMLFFFQHEPKAIPRPRFLMPIPSTPLYQVFTERYPHISERDYINVTQWE
jgi:radical SAM superfamily enzyme YgiQ (UPF0313 family)